MIERHGRLDVMINNAGIVPPHSARFERGGQSTARMQVDRRDGAARRAVNLTDDQFDRMIRTHPRRLLRDVGGAQ